MQNDNFAFESFFSKNNANVNGITNIRIRIIDQMI